MALTLPTLTVLIVDDSALYRQVLRHVFKAIPDVEVVGVAKDGVEAVEMIKQLQPDIVTLDVQMPNLDGLGVLREIKRFGLETQVLMVSSLTAEGAPETVDALLFGALDCVLKPTGVSSHEARDLLTKQLGSRVQALLDTRQSRLGAVKTITWRSPTLSRGRRLELGDCIAIGSSTGGPDALRRVLPHIPAGLSSPIFIVQHMPKKFAASLAKRLNELTAFPVRLAETGMLVEHGHCYFAPGGSHLTVIRRGHKTVCHLVDDAPRHGCRPSVDVLLESLVECYGERIVATILTGMGADGCEGCRAVKAAGGAVVAQDQESCAVYGMPKAVVTAGLADVVLPLDAIGEVLSRGDYRRQIMP